MGGVGFFLEVGFLQRGEGYSLDWFRRGSRVNKLSRGLVQKEQKQGGGLI